MSRVRRPYTASGPQKGAETPPEPLPVQTEAKPKLGRPTIFSQQLADEICERVVKPESMRSICLDDHMPDRSTIARWMASDAHFAAMISYARELQAEALIDEAMDISDNPSGDFVAKPDGTPVPVWENVQRAKLRCDMRRWYAAKLAPPSSSARP
jgi:hypothetical protein